MTNRSGTLYIGITNNLMRRVYEHKHGIIDGFTSKYRIDKLIYYETTNDVMCAISREKQLKGWVRRKKLDLIKQQNPQMKDLYDDICA